MSWMDAARARAGTLLGRARADARMDEEFRFHVEMETEKLVGEGVPPAEARRRALLAFGGVERTREAMRDGRGLGWLDDAARDVRYAWRTLLRSPAYALSAVLTIGLGVGASTAIFGVVDALFLRPPAGVRDAGRVVRLYTVRDDGDLITREGGPGPYVDYLAISRHLRAVATTGAFLEGTPVDMDHGEHAQRIRASAVSRSFLPLLGVGVELGRTFLPEEDSLPGARPAAVVSHAFWESRLGADPRAIGRTLELNGKSVTVVGVVERGFQGIEADPVDVWVPLGAAPAVGLLPNEWRTQPMMAAVSVLARMRPGTDVRAVVAGAEAALRETARLTPQLDPTPAVLTGTLVPAGTPIRPKSADLALWLMAVTGMVLVIACANVANLQLSRAAGRRREMAVRLSMGAGRSRLVRQRLTESLVISSLGSAVGLAVALAGRGLVSRFPLPATALELDARPLLFALGLAVATGLAFGAAPAMQAGRTDPAGALGEGRLGTTPGGRRLRRALVAVQAALSVVLLVGAGLFVRSLRQVYAVDPGAQPERLLVVSTDLFRAGYKPAEREAFLAAAAERVRRIPGVSGTAVTLFAPLSRFANFVPAALPGARPHPGEPPVFVSVNSVDASYFAVVGDALLRGRGLSPEDARGEPTMVVNETFARKIARGGSAVGACVPIGDQVQQGGCTRVVGIARDQRAEVLKETTNPAFFRLRTPGEETAPWLPAMLVVRTAGDAAPLAETVRTALQSLDPRQPYVSVQPLSDVLRPQLLPYRLGATLFTLFGALALVLAAVGLYGVLGYFIAERRPEIGIRRALGAGERHVVRWVLREGLAPVLAGLAAGLAAALLGSHAIRALLYGVSTHDAPSFATAAAVLLAVALLASWLPARRAVRLDPMHSLRAD